MNKDFDPTKSKSEDTLFPDLCKFLVYNMTYIPLPVPMLGGGFRGINSEGNHCMKDERKRCIYMHDRDKDLEDCKDRIVEEKING